MDILLVPIITQDELAYAQVLIKHHLQDIKEVYPGISIIPKMHYFVHMPRIALKFGPLARLWTMRYEAKQVFQVTGVFGEEFCQPAIDPNLSPPAA